MPWGGAPFSSGPGGTQDVNVVSSVELEVKNDTGNPVPVSGTVSVTEPVSVDDNGSSLTVDGTLAATQSGAWSTIPDRPSQKTGRTYKTAALLHQTTTQTLYTVTASKTLYVTSLALSGFNASTTTAGQLEIRDNETLKLPVSTPTAGVGALASQVPVSSNIFTFLEPLQISTSIIITITAGTLTYSVSFVGYEE